MYCIHIMMYDVEHEYCSCLLLACGCSVLYHRGTVSNATPMCSFYVRHCEMYNCSMCIANVLTLAVRCCTCRIRSDRRLALPASLLCDVVLSVACRFRL